MLYVLCCISSNLAYFHVFSQIYEFMLCFYAFFSVRPNLAFRSMLLFFLIWPCFMYLAKFMNLCCVFYAVFVAFSSNLALFHVFSQIYDFCMLFFMPFSSNLAYFHVFSQIYDFFLASFMLFDSKTRSVPENSQNRVFIGIAHV
jgi:hypothetical protein